MFGTHVGKVFTDFEWLSDLLTVCGFSADTKYADKNCPDNFCPFVLPRTIRNLSASAERPLFQTVYEVSKSTSRMIYRKSLLSKSWIVNINHQFIESDPQINFIDCL